MPLYLVQHGKCHPEDVDPERPLTDEGIADVKRIADVAAAYRIKVSKIIHSGKTRARQTAELFADKLNPPQGVVDTTGLKPNDDVREFKADPESNNMVVGHLPYMEKLASYLVTGTDVKRIFRFQNGGIVCIDFIDDEWIIKWALMPKVD